MTATAGESAQYSAPCPVCGRRVPVVGGIGLVGERLEWSRESECPECGPVLGCGRDDPPAELYERLLAEHGPARLEVEQGKRVAVLRVLRAELGVDLRGATALYGRIVDGTHAASLPELELLAQRLRAAGVEARAVRP